MLVRLFTIGGVGASLVLAALMLASASSMDVRFWPPGERDWRFWVYLGLAAIPSLALFVFAGVGTATSVFSELIWSILGLVLLVIGAAGFGAAVLDLGAEETSGIEGELRTGGIYAYSRNPQIVCLLVLILGVVFVINSPNANLVATAMIVWFGSMPFAEEPWLREQFGEAYEAYRNRVPRYLGVVSVRRMVEDLRQHRER